VHERVAIAPDAPSSEERAAIAERARRRGFRRFLFLTENDAADARDDEVWVRRGREIVRPAAGARRS